MITTQLGNGWSAIHNGKITDEDMVRLIQASEGQIIQEIDIPYFVMKNFVACELKDNLIAKIEQMEADELFKLLF